MLSTRPAVDVARAPARAASRCSDDRPRMDDREHVARPGAGDDDASPPLGSSMWSPRRAAQQVHADELGDVARTGPGRDVGERPGLDDPAVLEDHEPVGERGRVERIVGHEQPHARGTTRAGSRSSRRTDAARALVERGERLVEEQQPRFGGHRPRERDPLGLTARELARLRSRRDRRARPVRATPPRRRVRPRRFTPAAAEPERDVLEHGEVREEQVVLEDDADRVGAPAGRTPARRRRAPRRRARCARGRAGRARRARGAASSCPRRSGRGSRRSRLRRRRARRRASSVPSWSATSRGEAHPTPSQRSRSSASTATHTASSTMLKPIATSGFDSSSR